MPNLLPDTEWQVLPATTVRRKAWEYPDAAPAAKKATWTKWLTPQDDPNCHISVPKDGAWIQRFGRMRRVLPRRSSRPPAVCRVEVIAGPMAQCRVNVGEAELFPVGFEAAQLRRLGLDVGSSFSWHMRDGGAVADDDLVPLASREKLSDAEEREYEELYREFEKRLQAGETWSESTEEVP